MTEFPENSIIKTREYLEMWETGDKYREILEKNFLDPDYQSSSERIEELEDAGLVEKRGLNMPYYRPTSLADAVLENDNWIDFLTQMALEEEKYLETYST